jgi:hypothetical protein
MHNTPNARSGVVVQYVLAGGLPGQRWVLRQEPENAAPVPVHLQTQHVM